EKISVAASFYPLAYVAEQVLTGVADVSVIAAGNAEPHDFELSPSHIATITNSDFAIYIPDFMPAFDGALNDLVPEQIIDATNGINLLTANHEDEEREHESDHDHGDADPHLWLNPLNMTLIANQISDVVISQNPELRETINNNLSNFKNKMTNLDNQFKESLANCNINTLLVSHEAFGYLADQYGFTQLGISGISPEAEPSPARLAEVAKVAKEINATTIYYETIVDPSVANTLASEIGLVTAVLDPIETKPQDGDYLYAMQENLEAIVLGQGCS
ncbi:MAG: metal ABC transporter substrate-binding protein, partial [Candidatus Nanopelagicales bacterium]